MLVDVFTPNCGCLLLVLSLRRRPKTVVWALFGHQSSGVGLAAARPKGQLVQEFLHSRGAEI
jgi:hypothetical protein